jgi:glycosyltransferase involved in cell wall biosynthesis
MSDVETFPLVSIVVIGYNEAANLNNTFQAINHMNYPKDKLEVIYVDSGSDDGSVDIAKNFTNKIFIEDQYPSPGRNRNRGLIEANHEIVHFIDGDVIIDKDYLINIVPLFNEKQVQAIVGQLAEQNPNIWNKLAALSNVEKKEGYTKFTSTGSTYLKEALLEVNGYDERIRRGQETELGERFRNAGAKIWCAKYLMGSHNFGVTGLWQYLKKYEVNGKSMLQLALINGDSNFILSAKSKVIKQLVKAFLFLIFLFLSIWLKNILPVLGLFIITWFLRNRSFFKKKIKEHPKLVLIRSVIDFFFFWVWWYGFFRELFNFLFNESSKEFYKLRKMKLDLKFNMDCSSR